MDFNDYMDHLNDSIRLEIRAKERGLLLTAHFARASQDFWKQKAKHWDGEPGDRLEASNGAWNAQEVAHFYSSKYGRVA